MIASRSPGRSDPAADPVTLLRRIERHVPLTSGRIVLSLVRLSRMHVVRASWLDPAPETDRDLRAGRALEGHSETLRTPVREALSPIAATTTRSRPDLHAVVMVRCRRGRVVWLPSDRAWLDALVAESALHGLAVVECYLVTEHGWRCHEARAAGAAPSLVA
ncbi:MAG TPA: hypothetical protein VI076_04195 [Actinopolymorphaceae bacterium]